MDAGQRRCICWRNVVSTRRKYRNSSRINRRRRRIIGCNIPLFQKYYQHIIHQIYIINIQLLNSKIQWKFNIKYNSYKFNNIITNEMIYLLIQLLIIILWRLPNPFWHVFPLLFLSFFCCCCRSCWIYIDWIDLFHRFSDWRMQMQTSWWMAVFSTRNSSHCRVTLSMQLVSNCRHISHFQQLKFNTCQRLNSSKLTGLHSSSPCQQSPLIFRR